MCICTSICTCLINKHMYMYILGWPKSVFGFSILFGQPYVCMGLSKWLRDKESACQLGKHGFDPWGEEDSPGKGNGNPLEYGQRILAGYCPYSSWRCKESDMT